MIQPLPQNDPLCGEEYVTPANEAHVLLTGRPLSQVTACAIQEHDANYAPSLQHAAWFGDQWRQREAFLIAHPRSGVTLHAIHGTIELVMNTVAS